MNVWRHAWPASSGRWTSCNDTQTHRLGELAGPPGRVAAITPYPNNWRLARLREVPAAYRAGFQRAAPG
jgi:hypothetical protein